MKNYKPVICVCIISSMLMAALALSPGLKELMAAYQISESAASLAITLPYLISIPFTLLTGYLTNCFSKKSLSLLGIMIVIVTGVLPYFLEEFAMILVARAIMGAGLGLLFTLAPSLGPDYYPEGHMLSLTIGMQSAWAGSGGFVFNIISGYLVQTQTRNIYLVYGLCIIFFFAVLVLLPYQPVSAKKRPEKILFTPKGMFTALLTFLFISAGMTLSLSISPYLAETGMGNAAQAGYVTSFYSFAAFAVGCCYVFISGFLRNYAIWAACIISAVGMGFCAAVPNIIFTYVGAALVGAGLSIFMPSCVNQIVKTTPEALVSMNVSIMMVGSSVGQTLSGIFINPIAGYFGEHIAIRFYVSAVVFILVGLIYACSLCMHKVRNGGGEKDGEDIKNE